MDTYVAVSATTDYLRCAVPGRCEHFVSFFASLQHVQRFCCVAQIPHFDSPVVPCRQKHVLAYRISFDLRYPLVMAGESENSLRFRGWSEVVRFHHAVFKPSKHKRSSWVQRSYCLVSCKQRFLDLMSLNVQNFKLVIRTALDHWVVCYPFKSCSTVYSFHNCTWSGCFHSCLLSLIRAL